MLEMEPEKVREFQFLIGTIKTKQILSFRVFKRKFQFLIGTIKTPATSKLSTPSEGVSIPHRYDKNCSSRCGKFYSFPVSIPHRYDKNGLQIALLYTS